MKDRNGQASPHSGTLSAAQDWEMWVDLSQRITFPSEIVVTNLRPDLVFWSKSCHHVELPVLWGDALDEAFKQKRQQYAN